MNPLLVLWVVPNREILGSRARTGCGGPKVGTPETLKSLGRFLKADTYSSGFLGA